ncbi:PREDICTED: uncharacterized protein LOC108379671, partial [Rhagoletis zephyria]|uniref:uncharacterized protein LOC108379671 n=1 Tax=Rhagoletis zephyria TaxID=28612 RepID=UPI0008118E02
MHRFYRIKIFLICIFAIIETFKEVGGTPKTVVEQKVLPLGQLSEIHDGKLERSKRGFLDYLLSGLVEYFDYSDEDDSEEDEKYLICRNCTILISQQDSHISAAVRPTVAPASLEGENKYPNG